MYTSDEQNYEGIRTKGFIVYARKWPAGRSTVTRRRNDSERISRIMRFHRSVIEGTARQFCFHEARRLGG